MRIPSFRKAAFIGSLLIAVTVLFTLASFEVTSTPKFCGSCHIMRPYYESWKISSHNQIACVDCHIPPGIKSELRKKYEAISMVVRYFTGTYGTHPWAEVDDSSCLTCHERRLVAGKEVFKGILFNHTPHLTEMRRGKKLRCTSCHSQIVQGMHIAVTTSTCILCHFKNQSVGVGTANCQLCHQVPEKIITRANLSFHHADVKRFDMKCDWCHAGVVRGEGDVPQNRCLSCHNEAARLVKYGQTEEIHRIHVTQHKVDCLHCHNEIQHGAQKEVHLVRSGCESCHSGGHSPQQSLYAGIGGKGIPPQPSPMFLAGVRCEGCHFLPKKENGSEIMQASAISCMACHGAQFDMIYDRWRTVTEQQLQQLKLILRQAEKQLSTPYPEAFLDARQNVQLVENATPIHNVSYSMALLNKSVELINVGLKEKGKAPVAASWQTVPYSSPCLSCHQGIETQTGMFNGKPFAHFPHVMENKMECQFCHVPHEVPLKNKPTMIEPVSCASCHHQQRSADLCQKCHQADLAQGVVVKGEVLDRKGLTFDHAMHLEITGKTCLDCHTDHGKFRRTPAAGLCADCHG